MADIESGKSYQNLVFRRKAALGFMSYQRQGVFLESAFEQIDYNVDNGIIIDHPLKDQLPKFRDRVSLAVGYAIRFWYATGKYLTVRRQRDYLPRSLSFFFCMRSRHGVSNIRRRMLLVYGRSL